LNTELLISCDDWENRVAVLEEGSLAEIYFEREEKVIGSIYKGRVENVLPGMGACFVNIGLGRNAFLYVDDIRRDPINIGETEITDRRKGHTVNELLKVGDEVLVQIVKEPRGLKGARVSTNISLPGRYLVLMPTGRYSGVSSRIEDENERNRLKQIMRRVRPEGMATIVRTAARGVSEAELIADLGVQLRLWHGILESYKRATAPALLHKDLNLVFKAVRDFMTSDVRQVVIDSKEQYEEIRSTMSLLGSHYVNRLKLWEGQDDLFKARGIDDELQKLLKPKIVLPSGGYLILEHTEALTVIDVNTGKFTGGRNLEDTIVRTNVEAAAEIARQVRLRDIGGIIVVDFIDMAHERSRQQVIDTLTEALKRDRTRSTIQVFSNLGLLEFTRKRVGKDLAGQLRSDCPYCGGLGDVMSSESLAIGLLRQIRHHGQNGNRGKRLDLVIDPSVATQIVGWYREEFEKLTRGLGIEVSLFIDPQRNRETITLDNAHRVRRPLPVGKEIEVDLLPVRLPDPASGVAVFESNLIEVKDAANGAGMPAKIKVTAAEGNLAHAELAEPLQTGVRRRRRGRGKGKAAVETEAPIAPPTPVTVPAQESRRPRPEREEPAARSAAPRRREMPPLAYGIIDEEEDEDYTLRGGRVAGGSVGAGSSRRGSGSAPTSERVRASRDEGSSRRGRRGGHRTPQHPPATIVGGEGDIDYEDTDDAVVVRSSSSDRIAKRRPADERRRESPPEEERDRDGARRRRSGTGRAPVRPAASRAETDEYDEDHRDVRSGERGRRPAARSERGQVEDVREQTQHGMREQGRMQPRHYGPIRQLYGRPMDMEGAAAQERPRRHERDEWRDHEGGEAPARAARPREDATKREDRPERRPRREEHVRRPVPRSSDEDDELDMVVESRAPQAIDVEMTNAPVRRERPRREPRESEGMRPRRDSSESEEPRPRREMDEARPRRETEEPRPRREYDGPPRDGGRERGRGARGGRGRDRDRSGPEEPRVARTVKQLYPPPGEEPEPETDGPKGQPFAGRRAPRGPMMRDPGAQPPPKGKIRQLYPPPPFDEEYVEEGSAPPPQASETASSPLESMFVADEEEREERRRLARERADSRRADGDPEHGEEHVIRPPFGGAFEDGEEE
jgi:ribonuclease G